MNISLSAILSLGPPTMLSLLREPLEYGPHHQFLQRELILKGLDSNLIQTFIYQAPVCKIQHKALWNKIQR